ncbi:MAG: GAF domain-containing protein, partial [Anaerolineales bacterium]|nr:GAF domain-containing protein [Anaerolineales bacterium]
MASVETLPFALAAIGLGVGLLGLAWLGLRLAAVQSPYAYVASPVPMPVQPDRDAALMVAQAGGRLVYLNDRARQFFGLDGQTPSSEALARQVRPSETFLELFAVPGVARLTIGARQVEATSLSLPPEPGRPARVAVVLRETNQMPEFAADERTTQTLSVISEISRAISGSLDLPTTLDAVLANVGRLFSYEVAEVTLWEADAQALRPARVAGHREYQRLALRDPDFVYRPEDSLSGWIATRRAPLIQSDLATFTLARPKVQRADFPFRAYAGLPLLIGQELVGTLELISFRANVYKLSDLPLLTALADQAAIAIQNAQLYAEQQRRVAELTSLAEIVRAVEVTSEPREMYARLTGEIAARLDAAMVGFLLYDELERALVAQPPFRGVPDLVVDAYRLPVDTTSAVEQLWREAPYWLSNTVQSDPVVEALGLRPLAETAGVQTTLLAPIAIGGRRLGLVQVSNKAGGAPFTDADARLLILFAGQTAAILENARLVAEAQVRAEQAEGLRQIAATAAAGADLDGLLRRALEQAAALLHFDIGVLSLLDEARGELVPHAASIYGAGRTDLADLRLRTDDPLFDRSVTRLRRAFLSHHALRDRRITGVYRPLLEKYRFNSVMDVPLTVGDRSLGEMIVAATRERAFGRADLQLLATIASQLASAVERARLATATDQTLQRRVDQLTALTRVGREINQTFYLERILELVQAEVIRATGADGAAITLLDLEAPETGRIVLRQSDDPAEAGLRPEEQAALTTGRAQRRGGPPASLVVPIITEETAVGVIRMWSARPESLDASAEEAAAALAAQTAIAAANAQRYAEQIRRAELLRRRADQLAQLFEISRAVRSDRPLAENLENIAFGLQEAVGFNVVNLHILDPLTRRTRRAATVGLPLQVIEATRDREQPWENAQHLMRPEFRLSQSYFLPSERSAELIRHVEVTPMPAPQRLADSVANAWHPEDMLLTPLLGSGQEPVGLLSLDDPRDGLRPTRATIEIIEIFANQAALAIENARLFQAAERRAARLLA